MYEKYENLEKDFASGKMHPLDLKKSLAKELIDILKPIRTYFEKHEDMLKIFK